MNRASGNERPRPRLERLGEVSFLELFFDLAIIFALNQLSLLLSRDLGWENHLRTLVLLLAVWWTWLSSVRTVDWLNPDSTYLQWTITLMMFVALLMVAAVPQAFGKHGLVFAGAYLVLHVGRNAGVVHALHGQPTRTRSGRAMIWHGVAGILLVVGALLPATPQLLVWSVGVLMTYAGFELGWPLPGKGRLRVEHVRVAGDRLAERHREIFIIGLGELVLSSGISYTRTARGALETLSFAIAFANAALMLWGYLQPRGLDLAEAINRRSSRVTNLTSYAHGIMLAGIVALAIGDDFLILRPLRETRLGAAAILIGLFLYLGGRALFVSTVFHVGVWRAPLGMLVLAAISPVLITMPQLVVATVANLVLFGVVLLGIVFRTQRTVVPAPAPLAERLLRRREDPRQISYYELFFDLMIVFALTRLTQRTLQDLSPLHLAETLVLFAAIWWAWSGTAWSTDWFDPAEPYLQRIVLAAMFATLLMAAAVTDAFGRHGLLFAGAYVALHVGRGLLIVPALRGSPFQARSARVLVWFTTSTAPWLVGAFLPATARLALWALAIAIEATAIWLEWRVPGLGRAPESQLRVIGEHIAERHRQIYIIALGVPVLVAGQTYSGSGLDWIRTLAFAIAFANAVLLLWLYFLPPGRSLANVVNTNTARAAVFATYCHGVMVAGAVTVAAGDILLIRHPLGATNMAWSAFIIGGAALYLLGRILYGVLVFGNHRPWRGYLTLLLIGAMTPGLLMTPPLIVAAAVTFVLLCTVLTYGVSRLRGSLPA